MYTPPSIDIETFAATVLKVPLYPYQLEIARAVIASIAGGHGHIFTVMMARQSGKNQLSAVIEAYLLCYQPEGTIVKAAPTFNPQIMHSRLRLLSLLNIPLTHQRLWQGYGHMIGVSTKEDDAPALIHSHHRSGPHVQFFSAAPESNVVGATANLLLEIDEAQAVEREKFDRDFRPMASTTNATTILYGTAWSETTLLAQQRATNLEIQQRTGLQLHFEHDWHTLAALNPAYATFVEQEIARLGPNDVTIQTQYLLHALNATDRLFSPLQCTLLQGSHSWESEPSPATCYVMGIDVAGEDHLSITPGVKRDRDSTVISIGRVSYDELSLPKVELVHLVEWQGMTHLAQYTGIAALAEQWSVRAAVIDATGLGAGLASLLLARLGSARLLPFTFTRPAKSRLTYQLLNLVNSARLTLYTPASAPDALITTCWEQLHLARYRLPAPNTIDMYVDPSAGHDDFLISLALLAEALHALTEPAASTIVQSARFYSGEGRF